MRGGWKRVAPCTLWRDYFRRIAGVTQLVECNLAKVDVEGSNPFARSNGEGIRTLDINLGKVDVEGSNPFARSNGVREGKFNLPEA